MPKQSFTLNNFSGGLNSLKDPRDIAPNEMSTAQNIMVDRQGYIRTMGGMSTGSHTVGSHACSVSGNYGLFYFESDFSPLKTVTSTSISFTNIPEDPDYMAGSGSLFYGTFVAGDRILISGSTSNDGYYVIVAVTSNDRVYLDRSITTTAAGDNITVKGIAFGEKFFAMSDPSNHAIDLWAESTGSWDADVITLNSDSVAIDSLPVFYYADNALRVCDAEFANASDIKWRGYISRKHFGGANEYHDYYVKDNKLSAPTSGVVYDGNDAESLLYPGAGNGFSVLITDTASNGLWLADTYEVGSTFIYDGNQESQVSTLTGDFTCDTDNVGLFVEVGAKKPFDPRISGGRLYIRKKNTDEPWALLLDIHLTDGARVTLDSEYIGWALDSGSNYHVVSGGSGLINKGGGLDTYETINGFPSDLDAISIGETGEAYKTAVVTNRRVFVANIRQVSVDTGQTQQYGDRIMYTPVNKFDTFPSINTIDVVKGDAEEYVALEAFADRLLAFKQHSLHIINISSGSPTAWFLEQNLKEVGVSLPSQVAHTDVGVAWVNGRGVYLYDGQSVVNLIDNKIDPATWNTFYDIDGTQIGYYPIKNQLIIMRSAQNGTIGGADIYLYDVRTKSWVFGDNIFNNLNGLSYSHTNFARGYGNGLFFAYDDGAGNAVVQEWSDTDASHSDIIVTLKDLDFGDPSVSKKIYDLTLTYLSSGSSMVNPLQYAYVDTSGTYHSFASFATVTLSDTGGGWKTVKVTPTSPIECSSIQLKFAPSESLKLNINDISLRFRIKPKHYVG